MMLHDKVPYSKKHTLLLTSGLYRCWQRTFKKNTNYFMLLRISISLAILPEILIQIDYFF